MNASRLLSALCIATCALMMQGCGSSKQPELQKPVLQANLLQPCPELTEHNGGKDGASLLATLLEWAGQYHECAARHQALVEAVKP